jgi:hypothetical protein
LQLGVVSVFSFNFPEMTRPHAAVIPSPHRPMVQSMDSKPLLSLPLHASDVVD